MTTLLQINTSMNNGNGQSSQLARQFVAALQDASPGSKNLVRDVAAAEPVPHLDAERFRRLHHQAGGAQRRASRRWWPIQTP